jgi:hypothetical protein
MKYLTLIALATALIGCTPHEHHDRDAHSEEVSLYNEHDGLTLPEEMQRELGVQLMALTDTNAIPESAIIRGAKEDFTYVKDGKHFVRTPLAGLASGNEIVTHGVKDLWMIELLAIRGGEPCCR